MRYSRTLLIVLLGILILPFDSARAEKLDPNLDRMLTSGAGPFEVIVTFYDRSQVPAIHALAPECHEFSSLPMAYGHLTATQIRQLLEWKTVRSVYLNTQLEYHNHDAGEVTGAHYVQGTLGYKGAGVVINVLDSGIDGSREDVFFNTSNPSAGKVIQNVKITLNPFGHYTFEEDQQNTDSSSGHGTHVAGTVGGDGTCSAAHPLDPYYYRGAAPESKLVGLGAGETLVILEGLGGFDYSLNNQDRFNTRIITNSWGGAGDFNSDNPISQSAFEAYCKGMVVLFSAGNDGPNDVTLSVYASNPWVIGVGATDDNKVLTSFSSRGTPGDPFEHPAICAPGSGIRSVRAPLTPFGDYQPFVDLNHPQSSVCYTSLSGTSMATPFVAGAVALMLSANPDLSPDQVMDILYSTADPMPGYQFHQVGHGFIDVRQAVETALVTDGKLAEFLAGDRVWPSTGYWDIAEQNDPQLGNLGSWNEVAHGGASGGSYEKATSGSSFRVIFYGRGLKIDHPVGPNGGFANIYVDNRFLKTVDFENPTFEFGHITAIPCQETRVHIVDVTSVGGGEAYIDRVFADWKLLDSDHSIVRETKTIYGDAVNGIIDTVYVELGPEVVGIGGELSWPENADVDLYLYDPNNVQISGTEGATTNNPEIVDAATTVPGTYRWEISGYAGVANYTFKCTQTRLSIATPVDKPSLRFELAQAFPNPFNPSTTIQFTVAEPTHVALAVYDVAGRTVKTLVDESKTADVYHVTWDGTDERGHRVASGVYFYRMNAGDFTQTRKMVLLK
jgi:serine protease AprX